MLHILLKTKKRIFLLIFISIFSLSSFYFYHIGEIKVLSYIFHIKTEKINPEDVKVFVINLDRTPERYLTVKKQLDKYKINHKKFSAIDGYRLKIFDKKTGFKFFGEDLKNKKMQIIPNNFYYLFTPSGVVGHSAKLITDYGITRTLTAGEFGCFISHREIWKTIFKNNIKYALILEDDITLISDFHNIYYNLLENLPNNWDIIYFFVATNPLKETYTIINNNKIRKFKPDGYDVTLTAGYLINKKAAEKLYVLSKTFSVAVDDFISDQINNKKIEAYKTSVPYLTAPIGLKPEDSTIYEMGRPHF